MLDNLDRDTISDDELIATIEQELKIIQGFCEEESIENFPPTLQVLDSEGRWQFLEIPNEPDFNHSVQRRQVLVALGGVFYQAWGREIYPMIVMLSSEAWMKSFDSGSKPNPYRSPSDYPDAIDSIVVQSITLTKTEINAEDNQPRACLAVLEIKQRQPYIKTEILVEPTITPAGRDRTDLLNHFYLGWIQQSLAEEN
ncbi:hypothetical protein [Spirulina sp. 06S082]|uniref:hypothetical protein n=1 Tax=Spirulina sp. 06S082 TaxID=3110248 RepID=UPI002B20D861|nr:hypothetical protein [Spirulina sp. 06S082]MEA5470423.1 hypothetical protein [Spirulina sp. 06S082]